MIVKFEYNNTDFDIIGSFDDYKDIEGDVKWVEYQIDTSDVWMVLALGKGYYELRRDNENSTVYLNMDLEKIQVSHRDIFYEKYHEKILIEMRNNKLKDLGL